MSAHSVALHCCKVAFPAAGRLAEQGLRSELVSDVTYLEEVTESCGSKNPRSCLWHALAAFDSLSGCGCPQSQSPSRRSTQARPGGQRASGSPEQVCQAGAEEEQVPSAEAASSKQQAAAGNHIIIQYLY
jgi:hypothetical protein